MKFAVAVLGLCCSIVAAKQVDVPQRIVGGSVTTIARYPYMVNMMSNDQGNLGSYRQWCAGSLLTSRTVLSAAHCYTRNNGLPHASDWWRVRIGSDNANAGNLVYRVRQFIRHPSYNYFSGANNDIVVIQTTEGMALGGPAQVASISGPNYNLPDNAPVWAIGWGAIIPGGPSSQQLREVQLWTINRNVCRQRYPSSMVTDNMICSGWLDVGGRDQCQGDSGGPLIHNGIVVGLSSWGWGCASPYYPGVNTRVSSYTSWIVEVSGSLTAAA